MNRRSRTPGSTRAYYRQNLIRFGTLVVLCLAILCVSASTRAATFDKRGTIAIHFSLAPGDGLYVIAEQRGLSLLLAQDMFGTCFFGGLASPKWGPGRNGSLSLSGVADPMPVAGYRLTRGHSEYMRFVGFMEGDRNRMLVAHRVNVQVTSRLRIGVTETGVLSGHPSLLFYCPLPGLPLYALQHVVYKYYPCTDNDINVTLGLDFSMMIRNESADCDACEYGIVDAHQSSSASSMASAQEFRTADVRRGWADDIELYGELMIDDAQASFPKRSWVPDFIGGLVGVNIAKQMDGYKVVLNAEYIGIANYVYSHRIPSNNYTYREVGLGHPLGPDADAMIMTLTMHIGTDRSIEVKGALERHGEGRIGQPWCVEHGLDHIFLSGIVEKTARVGLLFRQELYKNLVFDTFVGIDRSINYNNIKGSKWSAGYARVGIGLHL